MKPFILIPIALISITVASMEAVPLKTEKARARFTAIAFPGNLKIVGETPEDGLQNATVSLDEKNGLFEGSIEVILDQLDTGLSLRNTHMKEKYLHTKEYPVAIYTFPPTKIATSQEQIPIQGKLTLCNQTENVVAMGTPKLINGSLTFTLQGQIKMTDFGMEVPQFMGVRVRDEVALYFEFRGNR